MFSLGGHAKQAGDEGDLPVDVCFAHTSDLSLVNHLIPWAESVQLYGMLFALVLFLFLDEQIALFGAEIARRIHTHLPSPETSEQESSKEHPSDAFPEGNSADAAPLSWAKAVELLDTIPGVNQRIAEVAIAELGTDMSRFPSASHLASWAGLSPGNNQSAGKQRTGQISPGDRPIRNYLVQAANAAAKSKTSYLGALYARLAARRGRKRALIAVAHALLISIYHMLSARRRIRTWDMGIWTNGNTRS